MSLRARQQEEKQERRDSILDAAEQVFFAKGVDRATMDDIARSARLSRGLLYVYFRDKQDILASILLRALESLRQRFRDVDDPDLSGADRILAMGRNYLAFSRQQPNYFDVLTRAASDWMHSESLTDQDSLLHCSGEVMEIMAQALSDGLADGSIDPARVREPMETALYLRGALHGVIMLTRNFAHRPEEMAGVAPDALIEYSLLTLADSLRRR
ncbi:MAG: TetR/AcrR family transcriptional regulator [Alcanivoracaceae bacterium]